jgi:hypothetical protein
MEYKYPPVYKYIILLILITTFLKYYKVITKDNYMVIGVIFTYMTFVFDFILIENHPSLFANCEPKNNNNINNTNNTNNKSKKNKKKIKLVGETENQSQSQTKSIETFEDSKNTTCSKQKSGDTNTDTDTDNLTEEIQKELDELDLD